MRTKSARYVLTGNTPIHVKFIGWLVITCAAGFGSFIWWAAAMSTKLDTVIKNQTDQRTYITGIVDEVSRLKEWRVQVDSTGTPMMVRRVDAIASELEQLGKKFDLHVATTTEKKTP